MYLAVLLVTAHVVTVVVDPHVDLTVIDALLPFGSSFSRFATGLGTVAFDLLIAVVITSALRMRLGGRTWRALHAIAYALWPTAALHALGAATDHTAVRALTIGCGVLVAIAVAFRLTRAGRTARVLL